MVWGQEEEEEESRIILLYGGQRLCSLSATNLTQVVHLIASLQQSVLRNLKRVARKSAPCVLGGWDTSARRTFSHNTTSIGRASVTSACGGDCISANNGLRLPFVPHSSSIDSIFDLLTRFQSQSSKLCQPETYARRSRSI